ncbi:MAG: DUF3017 domain-containing protein [Actinomycetes bacterium]
MARANAVNGEHPVRTGGWWPLLVVLGGIAAGLAIALVGSQTWRLGCLVIGAALVVGAVERAVLAPRAAGLLQVRSRWFDVTALALAGLAVIALAVVVPEGRG